MRGIVALATNHGSMKRIEEEIKQSSFKSEFSKAIVNMIFTNGWMHQKQLEVFKPYGLTTPKFNILRILRGQHPEPSTVNLLIDRMLDKSSNASRIVDRLESKGLVERKQCLKDRRAVDVVISPKGLDLLEKLDREMENWERSIRNLNEEESRILNELLDKMRGAS
jgi:DNA-binding MarR family transcriptional regulator